MERLNQPVKTGAWAKVAYPFNAAAC